MRIQYVQYIQRVQNLFEPNGFMTRKMSFAVKTVKNVWVFAKNPIFNPTKSVCDSGRSSLPIKMFNVKFFFFFQKVCKLLLAYTQAYSKH